MAAASGCVAPCNLAPLRPSHQHHKANMLTTRPTCRPRPEVVVHSMKERVAALPPVAPNVKRVRIPSADNWAIENVDGKRASYAIFNHLATTYHGKLNKAAALAGLELYDELVLDAEAHPGSHPSIELLMKIRDTDTVMDIVIETE